MRKGEIPGMWRVAGRPGRSAGWGGQTLRTGDLAERTRQGRGVWMRRLDRGAHGSWGQRRVGAPGLQKGASRRVGAPGLQRGSAG
jgi:hypothetical protein